MRGLVRRALSLGRGCLGRVDGPLACTWTPYSAVRCLMGTRPPSTVAWTGVSVRSQRGACPYRPNLRIRYCRLSWEYRSCLGSLECSVIIAQSRAYTRARSHTHARVCVCARMCCRVSAVIIHTDRISEFVHHNTSVHTHVRIGVRARACVCTRSGNDHTTLQRSETASICT